MKLDRNMNAVPMGATKTGVMLEPARSSLVPSASVMSIENQTGLVDRWRARREASRQAGRSLTVLKTEFVLAQTRIGLTALKLAEAQTKSAMVSSALVQIGALTLNLNQMTTAVEQRLTTGGHGEVISHMENRAASTTEIKELEKNGRISADESTALMSFVQADAVDDINRSRERTLKAKDAVGMLHGLALEGITRATDNVD